MLVLSITYATIAIPLKSSFPTKNRRLGIITLLCTVIIALTNLPSNSKEFNELLEQPGYEAMQDITSHDDSSLFFLASQENHLTSFSLYNDFMRATPINHIIDITLLIIGAMLLSPFFYSMIKTTLSTNSFYSLKGKARTNIIPKEYPEYVLFCLCTLLGALLLSSSNDLLFFILSIELQSYSLYIIASTSIRENVPIANSAPNNLTLLKDSNVVPLRDLGAGDVHSQEQTAQLSTFNLNTSNSFFSVAPEEQPYIDALPEHIPRTYETPFLWNTVSRVQDTENNQESFSHDMNANEPSEAAGLKYYLLGALASSIILLGIGIIYSALGTTNFHIIAILITKYSSSHSLVEGLPMNDIINTQTTFILGLLLIVTGLVWKFAGAPLHNWAIDVYDAVPTPSASWLAIIPKIALLASTSQLIFFWSSPGVLQPEYLAFPLKGEKLEPMSSLGPLDTSIPATYMVDPQVLEVIKEGELDSLNIMKLILFVSLLSLIIGSIGALTQPFIKRVLAYSSIGQIGFILLGLGSGAPETAIFYLIQYSLTNTGIWLCLLISTATTFTPSRYEKQPKIERKEEIRTIKELQGLHKNNLFIALSFAFLLFSTAGVPPMVGFFAKLEVISASLNSGYISLSFVAIISSLISATYYLIIIRTIWFYTPFIEESQDKSLLYFDSFRQQGLKAQKGLLKKSSAIKRENSEEYGVSQGILQITRITAFVISIITIMVILYILQGFVILDWFRCTI